MTIVIAVAVIAFFVITSIIDRLEKRAFNRAFLKGLAAQIDE